MEQLDELVPIEMPVTTPVGERLLDTASELFYDRGITAVGVDLISEQARATKRTLYQRFGSKDGLVAAYLTRRAHRWQVGLLTAVRAADPQDPAEALRVVFDYSRSWAAHNERGCAFVNAWADVGPSDAGAVRIIREEKQWMGLLWSALLGDAMLAGQVQLLHEGAQVAASVLADEAAFDRAYAAALRLLPQ
ncbi:TetR/AcrR family transcriptional regulator [Enemella evansiae]|uniref:TetR/AcrR family transcriptional regulator n=1 Tax=Enemella evansiae TaxID=2016499 RepID=UPI001E3A3D7F|nr:TetR/AcrR family transcriptional regulator [Enemella evansiae]